MCLPVEMTLIYVRQKSQCPICLRLQAYGTKTFYKSCHPLYRNLSKKNSNNIQTLQLSEDLTEWAILQLWMEERLELTLFWYKPSCFIM